MEEMEHLKAPRDQVETWNNTVKLFIWGSVALAIFLLIMRMTLI